MLVKVIRPFPFSRDGRTQERAEVGEANIPDGLVNGLISEGYIESPEGHPHVPMAAGRRKAMVDRVVEHFRAHLDGMPDASLVEILENAEQRQQREYGAAVALDLDTDEPPMLYGSSVLPAHVQIGDKMVQLGGLVVAAHRGSGLSAEDWNDLPEDERETALAQTLERLNGDLLAASVEIDPAAIVSTVEPAPAAPPPAADPVADTAAAFDHDGDGKPGGAPKGGNRKKPAAPAQ